ncbi:MAG: hypothetical protein N2260_08345 [Syntrophobacterales bacterium]|nr:hypothetical protein [Syntrophobacterales bacterium]
MTETIIAEKNGYFIAVDVKKRRNRFLFSEVKEVDLKEISGRKEVIYVTGLQPFHYARERITKGPPEAMRFQLQERIDRLGIFRNPPKFSYKIEKTEGVISECSIVTIDYSLIEPTLDNFTQYRIGLKGLLHKSIAVAFLVTECFVDTNVFTIYGDDKEYFIITTDKTGIRSIRLIKFDEFIPPSENAVLEELELTKGQYRYLPGFDEAKVLVFGPIRKLFSNTETIVLPDRFLVESEIVMEYPELFGAPLVPKEFNLLPITWLNWNSHLKYAKRVSMAMLTVAMLNGTIWGYLHLKERQLREMVDTKSKAVKIEAERLSRKIPLEKLKFLDLYNQTLKAHKQEPRMDELIARLTTIIPPDFKVIKLSVSKISPQASNSERGVERKKETPDSLLHGSSRQFSLNLSVGATAGFEEAHRVFKHILDSLHGSYTIHKSTFRFNDHEKTAECNFELTL